MKTLIALISILLVPQLLWATPKSVDLNGDASFTSEAPLEKIEGTAAANGKVQLDFDNFANSTGEITIPVKSMQTGNTKRDEHLNGSDWLDSAKCPNVSFKVKSATVKNQKAKGDVKVTKLNVKGDFTVHCKTKADLEIPVTIMNKGDKVKVKTAFTIKLADYDVAGSKGIVGEKVGKTIDVSVSVKGIAK